MLAQRWDNFVSLCCLLFNRIRSHSMKHYEFAANFRAVYDRALELYSQGKREASSYFTASQRAFLAVNGIAPQHLYDYAEDQLNGGEPGYDNALAIEMVRRDYFLNVQNGR